MDRKKRAERMPWAEDADLFEDDMAVASASECTGLIPSAPAGWNGLMYSQIYDIPLPEEEEHPRQRKKD
ncbi:MAG: hypothetical protein E7486_00340 [Ruminococcaceae bacterium]|nr:hypothetical protein [Oscillospiraceae bacterium]